MPSADAMEHWGAAGYSGYDPYTQSYNYTPSNPNPMTRADYDAAYQYALIGTQPQQAYVDYQSGLYQDQLNQQRRLTDYQIGGLNQDLGFANQDYSLALSGVGLDRERIALQLAQQQRDYGIQNSALARQLGIQPQYRALMGERFGLSEADINRDALRGMMGSQSQATARGSLGAQGFRDDIDYQKAEQQAALSGVGLDRKQYELDQGEKEAQLRDRQALLANEIRSGNESAAIAQRALDLKAQSLGLDRDQTISKINRAIGQLGIELNADASRIALELEKLNLGLQTTIPQNILEQINYMMGFG